MKRKIVAFIGILLIFSILTGCSKAITEGEVISKEFTPAHTQIMFIPIVHTNGKTSYTTLKPTDLETMSLKSARSKTVEV